MVAAKFSGNFLSQQVRTVWNGIQPSFVFGPATAANNQISPIFFWTSQGVSEYNAGFISYRTRRYKGLTLDANFTYGHSLDDAGRNQDFDTASTNAFNLRYDYGTPLFDRKYVFNLLGLYEIPLHARGFADYIVKGWALAQRWCDRTDAVYRRQQRSFGRGWQRDHAGWNQRRSGAQRARG